ncbi:MAG: hypothetical protein ACI9MC_002178 [Kiritimatiellia bacterium]|jgi:hypothetical protein
MTGRWFFGWTRGGGAGKLGGGGVDVSYSRLTTASKTAFGAHGHDLPRPGEDEHLTLMP